MLENYVLDRFESRVTVSFERQILTGTKCQTNISSTSGDLHVILYPEGIKQDKVFNKVHKPQEVGVFKSLLVSDSNNKLSYEEGDDVLIGADKQIIKKLHSVSEALDT